MELFDPMTGCLTDEGLQALTAGGLDELARLEAAEHLAFCDRCLDRYTALLADPAALTLEEAMEIVRAQDAKPRRTSRAKKK